MKKISYMAEAAALLFAFAVFRLAGLDNASALGGWIGRNIGTRLAASRKARANLEKSFPEWSVAQYDDTVRDMWDNLGRVIAEYPHLRKISYERIEVVGEEYIKNIGQSNSCVMVGAHLANWEIISACLNGRLQIPFAAIVREPNNPYAAKILERCRGINDKGSYLPKSSAGTRALVKELQQDGRIGILIDQKYNQGIPVEFFGRPAMTSTAPAQLARKFEVPIIPVQTVRTEGPRFRMIIHPPYDPSGKDEATIMRDLNAMLEGWIKERPGQWLWLHRRWDSKALQ